MGFTKKEMEEKGFTPEQIDFVMAERGKEVEKEKIKLDDLQKQLADKDASITELAEKAKNLDGTESTLKELQEKIAAYEKSEADRKAAEEQAKLDAEFADRFNKAKGDRNIKHPLIEKGRLEEFKAAFTDEQFKGKSDAEILEAIVKPEDWENKQQQTVTMPGGGQSTPGTNDLTRAREIMGLSNK